MKYRRRVFFTDKQKIGDLGSMATWGVDEVDWTWV
jgi:hypothetical protein